jgi:peptide/nickel transport system ATP-binding protein
MRIGEQIARVFAIQRGMDRAEAYRNAAEMLRQVGIPEVERHMRSYPHQLSGGMCQRVLIAMMVACEPELLIADEPTTGLDVTVQAQIFELIKEVQKEHRMAMLLITHDLGVVAELCDRMVVMYAGLVMEAGPVERVFDAPAHPYTQMLLESMLRSDKRMDRSLHYLGTIEEDVYGLPACRFAPRCPRAFGRCREQKPQPADIEEDHRVLCHLYPGD